MAKTAEERAAEEAAASAMKDPEVVAILQDPQVAARGGEGWCRWIGMEWGGIWDRG